MADGVSGGEPRIAARFLIGQWEADDEARARTGCRFDRDAATVSLGDCRHDREPQAAGMPGPVSVTKSSPVLPWAVALSVTIPPDGVYLSALSSSTVASCRRR